VRQAAKEERRVASLLGGKTLAASGAMRDHAGHTAGADLKTDLFWVEQKSTVKDSLTLQLSWLHKVAAGASRQSRWPALNITFQSFKMDWIGVPRYIFDQLAWLYDCDWSYEETTARSISMNGRALSEYLQTHREMKLEKKYIPKPSIEIRFLSKVDRSPVQTWQFIPLPDFIKLLEARK
jgi:hypothetical protein